VILRETLLKINDNLLHLQKLFSIQFKSFVQYAHGKFQVLFINHYRDFDF